MNERGVMILDSLFALSILLLIGFTLVPYASYLKKEVSYAKQMLHASEVAYMGGYLVAIGKDVVGTHEIDEVSYSWRYHMDEICVEFVSVKGDENYCIQANQAVE